VAGPIYAIKRQIKNLIDQNYTHFKLREFDEFKELENDMNLLTKDMQLKCEIPPPMPASVSEKKSA
jgi:signal transduction histidine kinase